MARFLYSALIYKDTTHINKKVVEHVEIDRHKPLDNIYLGLATNLYYIKEGNLTKRKHVDVTRRECLSHAMSRDQTSCLLQVS